MIHVKIKRTSVLAITAILALTAGCFAPTPTRTSQDLGGKHVSFTTSDGVLLRGHLYGTGSTGVILAHMYPADQSDWTDFAQVLAAHGYQALTFDFRGFTESEGSSGTEYAGTDLLAAYQFMRSRVSRIYHRRRESRRGSGDPGRRARRRSGLDPDFGANQLRRNRCDRFNPPRSRANPVCHVGRRSAGRRAAGNPVSRGAGAEVDKSLSRPRARYRDPVRTLRRRPASVDAALYRRPPGEELERRRLRALVRTRPHCWVSPRKPCR